MATVIASEAKLVVKIDTTEAERQLERLEQAPPQPGGAPSATPGAPPGPNIPPRRPNPGGDGSGGGGGGRGGDLSFRPVYEHGKAIVGATFGGGLYGQVQATAQAAVAGLPVPFVAQATAGGMKIAQTVHDYGPMATQALKAMSSHIDDPKLRSLFEEVLGAVDSIARGTAKKLDDMQAFLDTIGETIQETKDLAGGAMVLGGLDASQAVDFGANLWRVNEFLANEQAVRRRRQRAFVGQAMGDALGQTLDRAFSGRSGR